MIKIKILGTSASIPTKNRNLPSIFLMYKGERLLFDCGEGTQKELMINNLRFMKINKIFITHWHADHFSGMLGLIQTMSLEGRKNPLYVFGPKNTSKFLNQLLGVGYFNRTFDIIVKELEDSSAIKEKDYTITAFEVKHNRIPALGYAFQENKRLKADMKKAEKFGLKTGPLIGKLKNGETIIFGSKTIKPKDIIESITGRKIVYTGDTQYSENTIKYSKNADILIHDSTFASHKENMDEIGHSTASDAAIVARKATVKKLVLTHISRRYQKEKEHEDPKKLEDEARQIFKNSVLAEDGMEFILK